MPSQDIALITMEITKHLLRAPISLNKCQQLAHEANRSRGQVMGLILYTSLKRSFSHRQNGPGPFTTRKLPRRAHVPNSVSFSKSVSYPPSLKSSTHYVFISGDPHQELLPSRLALLKVKSSTVKSSTAKSVRSS